MDPYSNGHPSPSDSNAPYHWMQHASWNTVPVEDFPTATGPIIYEGFVPQPHTGPPTSGTGFQNLNYDNAYAQNLNQHASQYPPLDVQDDGQHVPNDRVQPVFDAPFQGVLGVQSHLGRSSTPRISHAAQPLIRNDETTDEEENYASFAQLSVDGLPAAPINPGRGRGRGAGPRRGRARGSGRGPGRPKRVDRPKGGWNKGTKTGPRAALDPGEEFTSLHEEAAEAFLEHQNYDKALELILKAISINPEIYSAHVLLSQIYFARHDDERGIAALFSGAHATPNDPAGWHQLADVCLQRASMDRFTLLKQAAYCFQRLLQIDREDHDARFQKAAISRELGHHAKALKDLDYLLQKMPHNSSILRQIAEVCLDINDVGRAIGLYDDALEHHRLSGTVDEDIFTWADLIVYVDLVARLNGVVKALQVLKRIARWLIGRDDEVYWEEILQDDREWDAEHAPRRVEVSSFDPSRHMLEKYGIGLPLELRVKMGEFRLKSSDRAEALRHFEWLLPDDRSEGAPLHEYSDLFLQVADALREIKEHVQALRYYEALHSIAACDDVEFWLGFGACSYVCEKRDQAFYCYEEAKQIDPTSAEARTQLSKLYAAQGDREEALLLARSAIALYESQLPQTERRKYERKELREAREAAQKAYKEAYKMPRDRDQREDMPQPQFSKRARQRARRLAREAAENAAQTEDEDARNEDREPSLTPPRRQDGLRSREEASKQTKAKRRSKKQKSDEDRLASIDQLYSTLLSVAEAMRQGDDVARNVWMDCAEALVEEFRSERFFYPAERYIKFKGFDRSLYKTAAIESGDVQAQMQAQEDVPMPSVESNVPTDYCGIYFADWLDVFLEYAILLANLQEDTTDCYAVIKAALDCNVWFHDEESILQIHTCWLVCALALRDEATLFSTVLRWFMREFVFCTDTYRLFGALNFYYPHSNDKGGKTGQMNNAAFRASPNQKYVFRQIMGIDSQLPKSYGAEQPDGPTPDFMRKSNGEILHISDRVQRQREPARSRTQTEAVELDGELSPGPTSPTPGETDQQPRRLYTPKELDVVLLTLYAQILYAGSSFPNALSYFYRAYTLEPKNTLVLFSIALSYMHQMLKRQNENRHMYLLQGWSFFDRYAEARTEQAEAKEREGHPGLVVIVKREIEYNRARCWQMLGMNDLAIRSYGRMMDMKAVKSEYEMDLDGKNEHQEIFSKEAAYAMMTMYATSGDIDSARQIAEKYLVVE